MKYVYILQSEADPERHDVGLTGDLRARLVKHNAGAGTQTAKYRRWRIQTYMALDDETKALAFERYLKSRSGRDFARKRLQGGSTGMHPDLHNRTRRG